MSHSLPNILLIVLDSVRFDRVLGDGEARLTLPTLQRLAKEGQSFERVYSTGSWTVPAHGSMFTGLLPSESGVHVHNPSLTVPDEETLAGTLSGQGYTTVGFSPNPWVSPEFDFDRGFDEFFDLVENLPFDDAPYPRAEEWSAAPRKALEVAGWCLSGNPIKRIANGIYTKFLLHEACPTPAETVNDKAIDWIRENRESPFFAFVNYMDAHEPYRLHKDYLERPIVEIPDIMWNLGSHENELSAKQRQQLEAVYDGSVRYLDAQLRTLLVATEETDRDTIVMVVSDHGQSLGENEFWGHGSYLHDALVHVPAILWSDSPQTGLPHELVSLADVPRILCDLVDVKFGASDELAIAGQSEKEYRAAVMESHSPIEPKEGSTPPGISERGYRGLYCDGWRLLRNLETSDAVVEQVGGAEMSESEAKSILFEFEGELDELVKGPTELSAELDDSTKQALENLGYL